MEETRTQKPVRGYGSLHYKAHGNIGVKNYSFKHNRGSLNLLEKGCGLKQNQSQKQNKKEIPYINVRWWSHKFYKEAHTNYMLFWCVHVFVCLSLFLHHILNCSTQIDTSKSGWKWSIVKDRHPWKDKVSAPISFVWNCSK